jgi:acyl carrier protein
MDTRSHLKELIIEASDRNVTMEDLERVGDSIKQLGIDSLVKIRLIVLIEENFDLNIDVEEVSAEVFDQLSSLQQYVESGNQNMTLSI